MLAFRKRVKDIILLVVLIVLAVPKGNGQVKPKRMTKDVSLNKSATYKSILQKDIQLKKSLQPLLKQPVTKGMSMAEKAYVEKLHSLASKLDGNISERQRLEIKINALRSEIQSLDTQLEKTSDPVKRKKLLTKRNQLQNELNDLVALQQENNRQSDMLQLNLQDEVQNREQSIQLMSNMAKTHHETAKAIIKNIR